MLAAASTPSARPRRSRDQGKGASLFGYTSLYGSVPGGQAEYLRVPQAQFGPIKVPDDGPDERYLFLSDILPTAWQAVEYADVPAGGTLAVFGLGPVGQFCRPDRPPPRRRAGSSASTWSPSGWRWPAGTASRSLDLQRASTTSPGALIDLTDGRGPGRA